MKRETVRIAALFLIPCLLTEPVTASALAHPPTHQTSRKNLFTNQALVSPSHWSGWRSIADVPSSLRAAAALFLGWAGGLSTPEISLLMVTSIQDVTNSSPNPSRLQKRSQPIGNLLASIYQWLTNGLNYRLREIEFFWAPAIQSLLFQVLIIGAPMYAVNVTYGKDAMWMSGVVTLWVSALLYGSRLTHLYIYRGKNFTPKEASDTQLNELFWRGVTAGLGFLVPFYIFAQASQDGTLSGAAFGLAAVAGYMVSGFIYFLTNFLARNSNGPIGTSTLAIPPVSQSAAAMILREDNGEVRPEAQKVLDALKSGDQNALAESMHKIATDEQKDFFPLQETILMALRAGTLGTLDHLLENSRVKSNIDEWIQKHADSGEVLDLQTGQIVDFDHSIHPPFLKNAYRAVARTMRDLAEPFMLIESSEERWKVSEILEQLLPIVGAATHTLWNLNPLNKIAALHQDEKRAVTVHTETKKEEKKGPPLNPAQLMSDILRILQPLWKLPVIPSSRFDDHAGSHALPDRETKLSAMNDRRDFIHKRLRLESPEKWQAVVTAILENYEQDPTQAPSIGKASLIANELRQSSTEFTEKLERAGLTREMHHKLLWFMGFSVDVPLEVARWAGPLPQFRLNPAQLLSDALRSVVSWAVPVIPSDRLGISKPGDVTTDSDVIVYWMGLRRYFLHQRLKEEKVDAWEVLVRNIFDNEQFDSTNATLVAYLLKFSPSSHRNAILKMIGLSDDMLRKLLYFMGFPDAKVPTDVLLWSEQKPVPFAKPAVILHHEVLLSRSA